MVHLSSFWITRYGLIDGIVLFLQSKVHDVQFIDLNGYLNLLIILQRNCFIQFFIKFSSKSLLTYWTTSLFLLQIYQNHRVLFIREMDDDIFLLYDSIIVTRRNK